MAEKPFRLGDTVKVTAGTHKGKRAILDHPAYSIKHYWWVRLDGQPVARSVTSLVDESDMKHGKEKAECSGIGKSVAGAIEDAVDEVGD